MTNNEILKLVLFILSNIFFLFVCFYSWKTYKENKSILKALRKDNESLVEIRLIFEKALFLANSRIKDFEIRLEKMEKIINTKSKAKSNASYKNRIVKTTSKAK